jgi:hypothetical protein
MIGITAASPPVEQRARSPAEESFEAEPMVADNSQYDAPHGNGQSNPHLHNHRNRNGGNLPNFNVVNGSGPQEERAPAVAYPVQTGVSPSMSPRDMPNVYNGGVPGSSPVPSPARVASPSFGNVSIPNGSGNNVSSMNVIGSVNNASTMNMNGAAMDVSSARTGSPGLQQSAFEVSNASMAPGSLGLARQSSYNLGRPASQYNMSLGRPPSQMNVGGIANTSPNVTPRVAPNQDEKTDKLMHLLASQGFTCKLVMPPSKDGGNKPESKGKKSCLRLSQDGKEFILEVESSKVKSPSKKLVFKVSEVVSVNKGRSSVLAAMGGDDSSFLHFVLHGKPELNIEVDERSVRDALVTGLWGIAARKRLSGGAHHAQRL